MLYRTIDIDFPVPLLPHSLETEMPNPELEDTQPRLAVPLAGTATEKQAAYSSDLSWLWPTIIILSAFAAYIVTFVMPYVVVRPLVVMWFLFICPGMVVVRFLRLKEVVVEWTFAIALSFSIDAIVASIFLYAGKWSPTGILSLLIGICLCGAIVHFATLRR